MKGREAILTVQVPAWHVGVLKIDGETQALLLPGLTAYWKVNHLIEAKWWIPVCRCWRLAAVRYRPKIRVNLRLNPAGELAYKDKLLAFGQLIQNRRITFTVNCICAARGNAHAGTKLLEDKQVIDEVGERAGESPHVCIEVFSSVVKDIVPPGDMKAILSHWLKRKNRPCQRDPTS